MRAGDHVHHRPSGEDWVVAYVNGDRLCACGWPETLARVSDCELIKKCSNKEHREVLSDMITAGGSRGAYAKHALRQLNETGE